MSESPVNTDQDISSIIEDAGGDPEKALFRDGKLICPDVTQAALDAAIAGYDSVAAAAKRKDKELRTIAAQLDIYDVLKGLRPGALDESKMSQTARDKLAEIDAREAQP